MAQQSALKL